MIDSLIGYNKAGQVKRSALSEVEAYGIKFRPRQSMFKDVKEARRMFVKGINEILADTPNLIVVIQVGINTQLKLILKL